MTEFKDSIVSSPSFLHLLTNNIPDMLWAKDIEGRYLFANQAICENLLMAESPEEVLGKTDVFFATREREKHPENPDWHTFGELCFDSDKIVLEQMQPMRFEEYGNVKGKLLYLEVHKAPFFDNKGQLIGTVGSGRDITEQKLLEERLQNANSTFESLLDSTIEGLLVFDESLRCIQANQVAESLTGYTERELIGKHALDDLVAPDFHRVAKRHLQQKRAMPYEMEIIRKDGKKVPVLAQGKDMKMFNKTVRVSAIMDISAIKAAKKRIEKLAYFDELTGLSNRRLLEVYSKEIILQGARTEKFSALLLLDIDNFKKVNDSLGHDIGDNLLKHISEELQKSVRATDHIIRMGGDEFVILLGHLDHQSSEAALLAEHIALNIQSNIKKSLKGSALKLNHYEITVSIGITLFCDHHATTKGILKEADLALYAAKENGKNTIKFFNQSLQLQLDKQIRLEQELHQAIAKKEFVLYLQPLYNQQRRIIAAEALVRWMHPEKGLLPPSEFIPEAEKSGQLLDIDKWVLQTVCRQLAQWKKAPEAILHSIVISINISPKQFAQKGFVQDIYKVIQDNNVSPQSIRIELTENVLASNLQTVAKKIEELNQLGMQVALDDFGTGFSSLSYLKNLPIDAIKIDRSFVDGIPSDSNDIAIIDATLAIANALTLQTVAEGIETEEQFEHLVGKGCKSFQGYHFSRPMDIHNFEQLVANNPIPA